MKIPIFEMERMQSTWENLVDYDMSESGVRPITLRGLVEMGLDLDAALVGGLKAGDDAQQRRLAAAAGAKQRNELALGH